MKLEENLYQNVGERLKGFSSMFIMPNDRVSVENLPKGIIIVSAMMLARFSRRSCRNRRRVCKYDECYGETGLSNTD